MKVLFSIFIFCFTSKVGLAKNISKVKDILCENDILFTGEIIEISNDKYRFSDLSEKVEKSTSFRIAKIKVEKILKNTSKYKYINKESFLTFLTPSLKKSNNGFDHMLIRRNVGEKGLWVSNGRNVFTGDLNILKDTRIPLDMNNKELKTQMQRCM